MYARGIKMEVDNKAARTEVYTLSLGRMRSRKLKSMF
jgi:hypothetical protein